MTGVFGNERPLLLSRRWTDAAARPQQDPPRRRPPCCGWSTTRWTRPDRGGPVRTERSGFRARRHPRRSRRPHVPAGRAQGCLRFAVDVADDVCGGWRRCHPPAPDPVQPARQRDQVHRTRRASRWIASPATGGLQCSVRDTGPGLDAEQQRRLFRRFEQAEGARTASRYGGSGSARRLICQGTRRRHGWRHRARQRAGRRRPRFTALPSAAGARAALPRGCRCP